MSLTFPTQPTVHGHVAPPGQPKRASHCRCHPGPTLLRGSDTCLTCGRHTLATIATTWADRARALKDRRR